MRLVNKPQLLFKPADPLDLPVFFCLNLPSRGVPALVGVGCFPPSRCVHPTNWWKFVTCTITPHKLQTCASIEKSSDECFKLNTMISDTLTHPMTGIGNFKDMLFFGALPARKNTMSHPKYNVRPKGVIPLNQLC